MASRTETLSEPPRGKSYERLNANRREAERRLAELKGRIDGELGTLAPKRAIWAIPLVAFASGLALALAVKTGKKRDR